MKQRKGDLFLLMLASPVYLLRGCMRAYRHVRFLNVARIPAIVCECGDELTLVGLWRCGCGFTYRGHLLRFCPICGTLPQVVRCYACGVTTKLPEP